MFAKSKEEVPGLYHANAREYESQSGRFLTRDHYRYMDYADSVSLNLYQYAKSNPLRYVDYDGHLCIEEPSYMERTWNCVVMGSYSDDVTVLGIIINVLLGLAGGDIPADLRDLSADLTVNFAPQELSWWATTLIDVAALFPVIGALKHLDEVGVAVKGAVKSVDGMLSGVKYTDSMLEGIGEAIKTCRKNSEELRKKAQDALEESKKKLRSVKNSGEELVEGGGDTSFTWKLRGEDVTLNDVKVQEISYVKRSSTELKTLRDESNTSTRKAFLEDLGKNAEYLKNAGFSETDILKIQSGRVPDGWQVHHKLPLDDSGTNSFDNLVLIQNEPYHKVITNYQNSVARQMEIGKVQTVQWPMPNGNIYPAQH